MGGSVQMTDRYSPDIKEALHYLSAIKVRLELLYEHSTQDARLLEHLSDEVDWVDAEIERLRSTDAAETPSTLLTRARQFVADSGSDDDDSEVNAARNQLLAEMDAALTGNVAQPKQECRHPNKFGSGTCSTDGSGTLSWHCQACGASGHDSWGPMIQSTDLGGGPRDATGATSSRPNSSGLRSRASDVRAVEPATGDLAQPSWQLIETAPMDGTEIIGVFHRRYDEDGPATVYGPWTVAWDGRKWRSSWDGSEVISSESDFGTEYKGPDIDPTHWMPLPGVSIPSTEHE